MAYFTDAAEVRDTLGRFFGMIMEDPMVGAAFASTGALMRVSFTAPDTVLWIDCRQTPPVVSDHDDGAPDMELAMTADNGHRFWLGRLALPVALASRKIKVTGSTGSLMKLLPALKPTFRRYEQYLVERGRDDLVRV